MIMTIIIMIIILIAIIACNNNNNNNDNDNNNNNNTALLQKTVLLGTARILRCWKGEGEGINQDTFGHWIWLAPWVYCQFNIHQSLSIKIIIIIIIIIAKKTNGDGRQVFENRGAIGR